MIRVKTGFAVCFLGLVTLGSIADAQFRERQSFLQRDIGTARIDRAGNGVVTMNPSWKRKVGPDVYEFFRKHEQAHLALNHFGRNISEQQAEAEADCYAARNSSPQTVQQVMRLFQSGVGGTSVHGSGPQRARRVAGCTGGSSSFPRSTSSGRVNTSNVYAAGVRRPSGFYRVVRQVPTRTVYRQSVSPVRTYPAYATQPQPVYRYRTISR